MTRNCAKNDAAPNRDVAYTYDAVTPTSVARLRTNTADGEAYYARRRCATATCASGSLFYTSRSRDFYLRRSRARDRSGKSRPPRPLDSSRHGRQLRGAERRRTRLLCAELIEFHAAFLTDMRRRMLPLDVSVFPAKIVPIFIGIRRVWKLTRAPLREMGRGIFYAVAGSSAE